MARLTGSAQTGEAQTTREIVMARLTGSTQTGEAQTTREIVMARLTRGAQTTREIVMARLTSRAQTDEPVRRRNSQIGVGFGYATTSSTVEDVFGEGIAGSFYVNQRVFKLLGVRLLYGGISLGAPEEGAKEEIYLTGIDYFGSSFRNVSMTLSYLTIGPSVQFHFGGSHSVLAAAAYGFYDVKLDLASLEAHRLSPRDNRSGLNATVMYAFWIGDSWGLQARLEYHRIDTTNDPDDLYYAFVRGDSDPQFFTILIGAQIGYR
jgi:hypothetical protein